MAKGCPVKFLMANKACEHPDDLTADERKALHQFANRVIAAGKMLYKKVPRRKAEPMIRRKWLEIATELRRS